MRDHVQSQIDRTILNLYRNIRYPVFPIEPSVIIRKIPYCRYISYDRLAYVSHTTYQEVVHACNSLDGCTHYDVKKDRYLIAINDSDKYNASKARIRWTSAHELGHVLAGHFIELFDTGRTPSSISDMEEEADYFAASLLAPLPAIKLLRAKRPADIRDWFGLSQTAAEYRWADYKKFPIDTNLEDYFHIFFPRSNMKDSQRLNTRRIDIAVDTGFIG